MGRVNESYRSHLHRNDGQWAAGTEELPYPVKPTPQLAICKAILSYLKEGEK